MHRGLTDQLINQLIGQPSLTDQLVYQLNWPCCSCMLMNQVRPTAQCTVYTPHRTAGMWLHCWQSYY